MKKLSYAFTRVLINNNIISLEDQEIYAFGARSGMQQMLGIMVILLEGILIGKVFFTVTFLLCFSTMRRYFNGYHAKNRALCCLLSGVLFAAGVFIYQSIVNIMDIYNLNLILLSVFLVMIVIKHYFISSSNIDNDLKEALIKDKLKSYRLLVTSFILYNAMYALGYIESSFGVYIAIVSICLLYVIKFLSVHFSRTLSK